MNQSDHHDKSSEEPLPGKDCSWSDKTAALESGDNDGKVMEMILVVVLAIVILITFILTVIST